MTCEKHWENGHLITFIIYLKWTITIISILWCVWMAVKNFQWIKMPFIRFEIRFHLNTVAEMVYYTKHHAFSWFFGWFSGDFLISIDEFSEASVCTNGTFTSYHSIAANHSQSVWQIV